MPRAELLWPVHYPAYVQRDQTVKVCAGEPSTGYSVNPFWCKPQHSWWSRPQLARLIYHVPVTEKIMVRERNYGWVNFFPLDISPFSVQRVVTRVDILKIDLSLNTIVLPVHADNPHTVEYRGAILLVVRHCSTSKLAPSRKKKNPASETPNFFASKACLRCPVPCNHTHHGDKSRSVPYLQRIWFGSTVLPSGSGKFLICGGTK